MYEQNRKPNSSEKLNDLKALEQRLSTAKAKHHKSDEENTTDGSTLGMAWRLSTELVVAVLVGAGLGFGLDKLFNTQPWILVVGLGFGFATGIRSVMRTAARMDAASAHIPIGEDIEEEDDENEDD